jgi:ABC-type hemin transport system substrate-binding protein
VSLSPALSRTLVDFGLADKIVGRSAFCDFLDQDVPVVGDLQRVNYERLLEVRPTHVLVQPPAAGIDAKLVEMAETHRWTIGAFGGLNTIDDIEQVVRDLPLTIAAEDTGLHGRLTARAAELQSAIEASLIPPKSPFFHEDALLVYRTEEPIGVFGRATYLNDVLVRLGARNATEARNWASLSLEDVSRLDPSAIILIRPGAWEDADPMEEAGPLATLGIEVIRERRVAIIRHRDALLPSTGIIGVADELRGILRDLAKGRERLATD